MKLLILAALVLSPAAFAKGKGGSPQTHHCELNGATVQKTKKACKKAGGSWAKGAPAADAAPATPAK
jgi:hypothetical protein